MNTAQKESSLLLSCLTELSVSDQRERGSSVGLKSVGLRGATRESLFPIIAKTLFYIPAELYIGTGDPRASQRARIVALDSKQKHLIPAFTSESGLRSWGGKTHDALPIYGCDFAEALPREASVIVNPEGTHAVFFSADELSLLSKEHMKSRTALKRARDVLLAQRNEDSLLQLQLAESLEVILAQYPEVVEGYLIHEQSETSDVILGLLCEEMPIERRFFLVSDIAELSKGRFGEAGMIQVFDDLHRRASSSWEIFNTLTPFYVRSSLLSNVEKIASAKVDTDATATGGILQSFFRGVGRGSRKSK